MNGFLLFALIVLTLSLLALAVYFVPIALSTVYAFRGRIENDHFMIRLVNTNFLDIELNSRTARFLESKDPVKRWEVKDGQKVDEEDVRKTYGIGLWPVYTAMKVVIPVNTIDVVRPQDQDQEKDTSQLIYKIYTEYITTRTPPRFLTHGFQTSPVDTKEIIEDKTIVFPITEVFRVELEIFNPYLAFVRIASSDPGQGFMDRVNGVLQSTARQITAEFSFKDILLAIVEEGGRNESGEQKEKRKRFGQRFKSIANKNLADYGVWIRDIDMLDYAVKPDMAERLQASQKAMYTKQETIILAEGDKKKKELLAVGDAAEMKELAKALNNNTRLIETEIRRRGQERGMELVGKNYKGDYLTVNVNTGGGHNNGPVPAVLVGGNQGEKFKEGGNRPHERDGKKNKGDK